MAQNPNVRWPPSLYLAAKKIDAFWEEQEAKHGVFRDRSKREAILQRLKHKRKRNPHGD